MPNPEQARNEHGRYVPSADPFRLLLEQRRQEQARQLRRFGVIPSNEREQALERAGCDRLTASDLAGRLRGETREDLAADARALVAALHAPRPLAEQTETPEAAAAPLEHLEPLGNMGGRMGGSAGLAPAPSINDAIRAAFRGGDPRDFQTERVLGGGEP